MPYSTHPMSSLTHHTHLTTPHNLLYSYYLSPSFASTTKSHPSLPILLFLHGYPDDAYMWAGTVPTFLNSPYPFVIVDLLGFGGTSKPGDVRLYDYRIQADAIASVLDWEGVVGGRVIPVGHDWGSATAQRFYLYHRDRCIGLSINSLAYQIPSAEPFNLEEANASTTKRFGYPQWEYWHFFTSPSAPNLLRLNPRRFYEVMHGHLPSPHPSENSRDIWMREMFCVPGAMHDYITQTGNYSNYTVDLKAYAEDEALWRRFEERLTRDGVEGAVNYYHSLRDNVMINDEKVLAEGGRSRIEVPVLYIGQTGDWMSDATSLSLVPDLEEKVVEAGHWVFYEKPEEMAGLILDWVERKFPVVEKS
ncbi:hypothetical protein M409DRAFT_23285 [Zasmidium cellare ATCC 36951]|uniref:AB hydrolase-1 domain-containing protein n=1 Tax=Zasmidium cellare ATCC 36951 TaxID=1080233 RepID=A0A6A6CHI1_ZASCE|nr:uncharacterized protein M409DRAFT_23285 [Zasmidium cellare ATCC 36951]KAF2166654.1 hypothetical protein M409DRAFT_23285 [Zasmidium cellare ATCC 36951]